ncbi:MULTISPECIES: alpha/beta fold hydrolase [Streptomyces]|uniref:Hydrolase n=1 Tax=Streptomyces qinglanensis TaxID=943816 RepID=A0A1E7K5R6_9ACTN|nr:alpha/beta fold hydrolase [Streptomyces qinglanensis]OEU99278.1 hydrolase [Streptomyces qinglanensis]OEV28352.1 hydrolase [Streptomyces nanshensis]
MTRNGRTSAVIALCCTVAGVVLVGCEKSGGQSSKADADASTTTTAPPEQAAGGARFTGTKKIKFDGRSVNVSCSGRATEGRPAIVLMHGGGDGLKKMAALQKTLSKRERVCSYDRLGAGASDKPEGPQTLESTGKVLTSVIERVVGDAPVVLAGHSLGGLIAARYAPDHRDTVKGLVLMDATSPTQNADLAQEIPESATGPAAELRAQTLAILQGKGPGKLTVRDGKVRSAGDIPAEVIKHGKQYLAEVPEYGPALERAWSKGQHKWLAVSSRSKPSTATKSGHYIYLDQPDVAVRAIERVTTQAGDPAKAPQ